MTEVAKIAKQIWDRTSFDVRQTILTSLIEWRLFKLGWEGHVTEDLQALFTVYHEGDNPFDKLEWTHGFDEAKATSDALARRQGDAGLEQDRPEEQEEGEEVRERDRGVPPRLHGSELADDAKQRPNRLEGRSVLSRSSGLRRRGVQGS
jgi:hypothetical protein